MTHNIVDKEGIRALVRQHKKDIEALGRLRARYHSNGLATNDQEEWSATAVGDAQKEAEGRTQCTTADDNDDENKKNKNKDNDERVERWLDWNEDVPASTINAAHPAVAATAATTGSARKPRTVGSSSGSGSGTVVAGADAGADAEHLPPIPPLSSHTTVSEEGIRSIPAHFVQSSKSQSASLAYDYEDSTSPRAAIVSPRPIGATSAVKKSLRLPRSLLNAQLTATNAPNAGGAGAGADHSRHGLTVFRSINSELERQQLQQHAANGARLVKKIGAVLAAERDATTTHLHHSNRHMPQHHHHHQRQKDQQQHQQQQQQFGESAEHLSPSSARRALKARNVLDSMTASSSSSASSATTTIISSTSRTNPLSSPSGPIATSTTRDAAYSDVMRI